MSELRRTLMIMGVYLAAVVALAAVLYQPLLQAFMSNAAFNGVILGVLGIGIIVNISQVLRLGKEYEWLRRFRTGAATSTQTTQLLRSLAQALENVGRGQFRLSALSLRTVLDGIRARLDESREISHYITGLLIFLGLLGTFWGLLNTIGSVGQVINGLDFGNTDFKAMFSDLRDGLSAPLAGMGTAFSSSLLGLGGSLVLGFLDIVAGQAQNRFFDSLEEWLSSATNIADGNVEDSGDGQSAAMQMLLHEMREQRKALTLIATHLQSQGGAQSTNTGDEPQA